MISHCILYTLILSVIYNDLTHATMSRKMSNDDQPTSLNKDNSWVRLSKRNRNHLSYIVSKIGTSKMFFTIDLFFRKGMVMVQLWKRKYSEHLFFRFVDLCWLEIDLDSERIFLNHLYTHFANYRLQQIDLDSETRFSGHLYFRFFVRLILKIDLDKDCCSILYRRNISRCRNVSCFSTMQP